MLTRIPPASGPPTRLRIGAAVAVHTANAATAISLHQRQRLVENDAAAHDHRTQFTGRSRRGRTVAVPPGGLDGGRPAGEKPETHYGPAANAPAPARLTAAFRDLP